MSKPKITCRMEFMLTLECSWGCNDCCRGLEKWQPTGSNVTLDQCQRFCDHLREKEIYLTRLKVDGGDPVKNPDFEAAIWLFSREIGAYEDGKLFRCVKVQSAYPMKAIKAKYNLPPNIKMHCDVVKKKPENWNRDSKNYKPKHVPWFVSPADSGILGPDDPPPLGSALTGKACELQSRCGRSFESWGFIGCAQEAVLGRMLGIPVHSDEFKLWADPRICRHCPMCLGKVEAKKLQARAMAGEVPFVGPSLELVDLKAIYAKTGEDQPW